MRPMRISLRLLPSGPDRVGEALARANLSPHDLIARAEIRKSGETCMRFGTFSDISGTISDISRDLRVIRRSKPPKSMWIGPQETRRWPRSPDISSELVDKKR